jgi:hypothetical protein
MAWTFNPNEYEEQDFQIVPVGDHRVRIYDVISKNSKAGNEMYEVTLEVSGYGSKLWFYLVIDPTDSKKTNQRIGSFFESFGITDYNLANYIRWKGKVGAVRVKHEDYNGTTSAKVAFCLNRKNQDKLPPAKFNAEATTSTAPTGGFAPIEVDDDALPFN